MTMDNFIKLKVDGNIRFRCTFCLAPLETELNYCAPLDCPGRGRKIKEEIVCLPVIAIQI
jgi:hypothetical protein